MTPAPRGSGATGSRTPGASSTSLISWKPPCRVWPGASTGAGSPPSDTPSAGCLLGLRVLDPETGEEQDLSDSRVKAGVLLATAGEGGANLTPFAARHLPHMNPSFAHMTTPALVVAGDADEIPRKYQLTVRGPDWMAEPYFLSPGRKSLLTLFGAEHSLGGIPGYEVTETTDENPARVTLIQQVTTAYLRHALEIEDASWQAAQQALAESASPLGRLESK